MKDKDLVLRPLGKEFGTTTRAFPVNPVVRIEGIYGAGRSHTSLVPAKN